MRTLTTLVIAGLASLVSLHAQKPGQRPAEVNEKFIPYVTPLERDGIISGFNIGYRLLKFDLPTSILARELPYFRNVLHLTDSQIRRFVFSLSLIEGHGDVEALNTSSGASGFLQIVQQHALEDYFRIMRLRGYTGANWFTAEDMRNPKKGYLITRIMPLRILNTLAEHYKLTSLEVIARSWNKGVNGTLANPRPSDNYWGRVCFTYIHLVEVHENNGSATACGPVPGRVIRPKSGKY